MSVNTDLYFKIFKIKKISEITKHELKRRYKILALKYHPDKKPYGNTEKFKIIHNAFEYIGNELKKYLKKEDEKFFNSDFHFYGDGSIYNIKLKKWMRLKNEKNEWIIENYKLK